MLFFEFYISNKNVFGKENYEIKNEIEITFKLKYIVTLRYNYEKLIL